MIICDFCNKEIKKDFKSFETSIFDEGGSGDTQHEIENLHKKCVEELSISVSKFIVKELKKEKKE